jgi:predicted DCC family thiol-disulfide oxidoreductase YuxK
MTARSVYHAGAMSDSPGDGHPVVLFDGVCNLCDAAVTFLIDRDPEGRLRFASLQSAAGRRVLAEAGMRPEEGDPRSIVFVEKGRPYAQSTALLRIVRHLRAPWPLLAVLAVLPRPVRDALYRFGAARRYRWFGRMEACRVPTPELRERFLE